MPLFTASRPTIAWTALLLLGSCLVLATQSGEQRTPREASEGLQRTGSMQTARAAHTATLLTDGTVLVAGGFTRDREQEPFASVERYDPIRGNFSEAGTMTVGRQSHSATRLQDGRVLLVGGFDGTALASTEVYDPATKTFTTSGRLITGRFGHRATLLQDGRVLISGGLGRDPEQQGQRFRPLASAEYYDSGTGTFTRTGSLATARASHTQTLLQDGSVLLIGGATENRSSLRVLASAERFDPATGTFRPAGGLAVGRYKHAAVLLPDGTVLVVGGSNERDWRGRYDSAERFDPIRNVFVAAGSLNEARFKLRTAVTSLADGTALIAGGAATLERYDPATDRFASLSDRLDAPRYFSMATLLLDGRVLITGGYDPEIRSTASAWLYEP